MKIKVFSVKLCTIMVKPLALVVTETRSASVIAKNTDGRTWEIPLSAIDGAPKLNKEIRVIAFAAGSDDAGQSALAKGLLNELLDSSHHV